MNKTEKIIIGVCLALTLIFAVIGSRTYENWKNKNRAAAQAAAVERDKQHEAEAAAATAKENAISTELTRLSNQCKIGKTRLPALDCAIRIAN